MQKNGSNGSKEVGNTKRLPASKNWCFTFNNYTEKDIKDIESVFGSNCDKFIVGKEIGEQGTHHLQGYISLTKKGRPMELGLSKRIHWEKCKGSEQQNSDYCSKEGNVILIKGIKVKKPLKILAKDKLYKWQQDVETIIKGEPDDRKIYWFWEEKGCTGKTTFAKYLTHHYGAVPIEGKKNDILYCAAEHEADIYIFDFERSMEEFISYGAMEKIKNGYYMCSKYESKPIMRNPPHIVCFANFPPATHMLSKDRWVIKKISNEPKTTIKHWEAEYCD